MEDEIDITRRAVGQVMWKYFHILNSYAAGRTPLCNQRKEEQMGSRFQTAPTRGARIITVALAALLALSSATSVRAQEKEKADADAEFLTKVVPGIAASVKIIDYEVKNTSDEKVRDFAERVLKQHKESVKTASEHAKRLNIAVVTDPDKDSKEMTDKLSKLKGADLDVAFLEWLSHIHHDTTLFENEVKNGTDPELKTYAKNSITAGNEHLQEARELLAKLKK
jgi:putative membrane protein